MTIEVAGPAAFFDVSTTRTPFTIRASPFQLRGLAAWLIGECVNTRGYIGGFATTKIQNMVDYIDSANYNPNVWRESRESTGYRD